jgi:protein-disulfide isomerase
MSRKTKIEAATRKMEAIKRRKRNRIVLSVSAAVILGSIAVAYSAIVNTAPGALRAATWDTKAVAATDIAMGDPKAPARITEYGALDCPHCADFHERAFGKFKKDYVDTGKVYFVYSPFPYNTVGLQAATVVACLPKANQADALSTLYRQRNWVFNEDVTGSAVSELKLSADESASMLTCITDGKMREQVTKTAYEAGSRGIASTPSFVINGGVYEGFMSSEVLGKIALGK